MKIFLCYISDLEFQSGVAEDLRVHSKTVSKVVAVTATKIVQKALFL
jgi:hypothetical protein